MKAFADKIIAWYELNKRNLPWRNTKNAYHIWLSEIILQQTRVDQGKSYYLKFISEFPTVKHLAKANNDKVMKLWQGLGYYSRARNLHASAKQIVEKHKGNFPDTFEAILSLKGVGEYTASAVASFAFDLQHAVVDGNVFRVLSRVFGIDIPIDSTKGKKEFNKLANELLDKKNPALYNQAIMEFGALQCKPVNPDCSVCPLKNMCFAYSKKLVNQLPVKEKKTKTRNRYFNYLVFNYKNKTIINKRTKKDIWINLYDFPLNENEKKTSELQFFKSKEWNSIIGKNKFVVKRVSPYYKHILSHQKIYARFFEIDCSKDINKLKTKESLLIPKLSLKKYAVPRLIDIYINEN